MAQKVAHLNDEAHALASKYCAEHGLKMKDWVSKLIMDNADGRVVPIGKSKQIPMAKTEPVVKKVARGQTYEPQETGDEPWNRPPFWDKPKGSDEQGKGRESD